LNDAEETSVSCENNKVVRSSNLYRRPTLVVHTARIQVCISSATSRRYCKSSPVFDWSTVRRHSIKQKTALTLFWGRLKSKFWKREKCSTFYYLSSACLRQSARSRINIDQHHSVDKLASTKDTFISHRLLLSSRNIPFQGKGSAANMLRAIRNTARWKPQEICLCERWTNTLNDSYLDCWSYRKRDFCEGEIRPFAFTESDCIFFMLSRCSDVGHEFFTRREMRRPSWQILFFVNNG